ncbi:MAG: hypothetical protein LBJ39_05930 [Tannerellaceae bacterium]|jgi:enamine deaminase RidA (YjgF/YER057c/UK114 family)|nr:hypothetical protein [Tannerellaceae bacterium]
MTYKTIEYKELYVRIKLSVYDAKGVTESHAIAENLNPALDAKTQYGNITQALDELQSVLPKGSILVMKRYFASDAINQAELLPVENAAVSFVQQSPLNGSKVSLWAYWVCDCSMTTEGGTTIMERPHYRHFFNMQLHDDSNGGFEQTEKIFKRYEEELANHNLSLKDNAIRTWIYVQGVDTNYAGMVEARRRHFREQGLTERTHYLASTGIEGKYLHPGTIVLADAYSIGNLLPGQVRYLKGSTHLNPTYEYGVTFERATAMEYGDRRHVFISGTASIDNKGQIVHPLDVAGQTERTLENISVLLSEGRCSMNDVAQLIVYLRDTADYYPVSAYMEKHHPDIPKTIVYAPVCRPGWLVEMECIAIKEIENTDFPPF